MNTTHTNRELRSLDKLTAIAKGEMQYLQGKQTNLLDELNRITNAIESLTTPMDTNIDIVYDLRLSQRSVVHDLNKVLNAIKEKVNTLARYQCERVEIVKTQCFASPNRHSTPVRADNNQPIHNLTQNKKTKIS